VGADKGTRVRARDKDGFSGSPNFRNYNKQVPVARGKTRPIVAQRYKRLVIITCKLSAYLTSGLADFFSKCDFLLP